MKTEAVFSISTLFLLFCAGAALAQNIPATEFRDVYARRFLANFSTTIYSTVFNNFPSDEANAVLQTRDGFLWFGGYNGLYRYDGSRFTIWDATSPNGFGSSNVRALYEDRDGILWIGTNDRGIVAFQNGEFTVYDRAHGLPSNTVRAIASDSSGRIYGGTPGGLFFIDSNRTVTTVRLDTSVQQAVVDLCIDADNNIFSVLNSGELYIYTRDGRTLRVRDTGLVHSIRSVSNNRVIAGARDGRVLIFLLEDDNLTRVYIKQTPLINISSVYEDSHGNIWLTGLNGIGFLDTDENYNNVGNPSGEGFYSGIWEDYQNGYWITATRGGVVKFTLSAFTDLNALFNYESGAANAVLMDNGNTYIGTNNGLSVLGIDGRPVLTDFSQQVPGRVRGLSHDSAGNIWISTYSALGVIRYTPLTNSFRYWTQRDGMLSDRARKIFELPNGVIAVAMAEGVNFIRDDTVVSVNEALETGVDINLPQIMVLSMVTSTDGSLYLGTDGNGVYAINKNGTRRFREEDGLTGGVVLRMLADNKNGVWVAASPGLSYIDASGNVTQIYKVPPYTFLDILQFRDDLILLTSHNIILTNADMLLDPDAPFVASIVDRASGINALINANAWNWLTEDGLLYFCTDRGISIYNFEYDILPIIPFAGVARIEIDGVEQTNFQNRIIIARDADRLTIELSFLSFGFSRDASLWYMLIGQDKEPVMLTTSNNYEISYTNLRGGYYVLQVWTQDSNENIGNFIEIDLYKELRFFEHFFVWVIIIALSLLLLTFIVIYIIRYRSRKFIEKQREYRTIISQALSAIANAIDAKDTYTSGHSARVAAYSAEIARRMGMSQDFIENLYYIGLLHDVGKIGIPNELINKPASLTDEEFEIMKTHSLKGKEILNDITMIHNLKAGAAEHHERWDGKGYYHGISGDKISLEARIIAIADAYDAMTSNRSYRKAISKEEVMREIKKCSGFQFDPQITKIVVDMMEQNHFSYIDVDKIIGLYGKN